MQLSKEFLDKLAKMNTEQLRTQYSDITQSDGPALTLRKGLTDDQIRDEIIDYLNAPAYPTYPEEEEVEYTTKESQVKEGRNLKTLRALIREILKRHV